MLKIPKDIRDEIITRARAGVPLEICGYLAGTADGKVKTHYPLTNTDASAEHFSFDPKEQFTAFKDASARGQRLIVCYHSHPVTPARPSAEDIKLAYDPTISYVIISLAAAEPVIKSFKIKAGVVTNEEIGIT
ncbi:MAG: M67 family metallopeptidase [Verrucomicrobiales bacterium]|jgi:proteasome lid subunit RPN8/RPN11|nr:M67 family metallopeptidase [Verrucomicrobiales bacterium]